MKTDFFHRLLAAAFSHRPQNWWSKLAGLQTSIPTNAHWHAGSAAAAPHPEAM